MPTPTATYAELKCDVAGPTLQVKEPSLGKLHAPRVRSLLAQRINPFQELGSARNVVENATRTVVLLLHPLSELVALRVLHPAVRILDLGAEIVVRDRTNRGDGWPIRKVGSDAALLLTANATVVRLIPAHRVWFMAFVARSVRFKSD